MYYVGSRGLVVLSINCHRGGVPFFLMFPIPGTYDDGFSVVVSRACTPPPPPPLLTIVVS